MSFIAKKQTEGALVKGCFTSEVPTGYTIQKMLGMVHYTINQVDIDFPEKSAELFKGILDVAKQAGANAVVNVKISSSSYEYGNGPTRSNIMIYGDAVVMD